MAPSVAPGCCWLSAIDQPSLRSHRRHRKPAFDTIPANTPVRSADGEGNPDKCLVLEFKPKSESGGRDGERQKANYAVVVPAYYNEKYRNKEAPADSLGGKEVMDILVAKCMRDGVIRLDVDVETYNMCDKRYECIGD